MKVSPLLNIPLPDQFFDKLLEEVQQGNFRNDVAELKTLLQPKNQEVPAHPTPRTKQAWRPNEREQAIVAIPPSNQMSLEEYCLALDLAQPFPEKWQRNGSPKSHREAWESKNERLRNLIKSERRNVWDRLKKS